MKRLFTLIVAIIYVNTSYAQIDIEKAKEQLYKQVEMMGTHFINQEFKSYVQFCYPKVLEMIGGRERMIEILEMQASQMANENVRFTRISFGEPTSIIEMGSELQCTIPQTLEIQLQGGRLVTKSTIIAISENQGENWYFIDPTNKDIHTIRELFPNISEKLVIPQRPEPTFYAD